MFYGLDTQSARSLGYVFGLGALRLVELIPGQQPVLVRLPDSVLVRLPDSVLVRLAIPHLVAGTRGPHLLGSPRGVLARSEERRVGKECGSGWWRGPGGGECDGG